MKALIKFFLGILILCLMTPISADSIRLTYGNQSFTLDAKLNQTQEHQLLSSQPFKVTLPPDAVKKIAAFHKHEKGIVITDKEYVGKSFHPNGIKWEGVTLLQSGAEKKIERTCTAVSENDGITLSCQ